MVDIRDRELRWNLGSSGRSGLPSDEIPTVIYLPGEIFGLRLRIG